MENCSVARHRYVCLSSTYIPCIWTTEPGWVFPRKFIIVDAPFFSVSHLTITHKSFKETSRKNNYIEIFIYLFYSQHFTIITISSNIFLYLGLLNCIKKKIMSYNDSDEEFSKSFLPKYYKYSWQNENFYNISVCNWQTDFWCWKLTQPLCRWLWYFHKLYLILQNTFGLGYCMNDGISGKIYFSLKISEKHLQIFS